MSCNKIALSSLIFFIGLFSVISQGSAKFHLIPPGQSHVTFSNQIEEDSKRNIIRYQGFYDGGGVAAADFNNDGLTDLYFTGNMVRNLLYLNRGDFIFEDITSSAGLMEEGPGWDTGVSLVDINADGWMDIYVCRSGLFQPENRRNILYINNGDLTFTDQAKEYGLDHAGYSTQATFFDFDLDGDLDMYLANYGPTDISQSKEAELQQRTQSDPYSGDRLFENVNGKFKDITTSAGIIDTPAGYAHSVGTGDFNGDGWPDIFVCNDFTEHDFYYLNNGDKTFTESMKKSFKHLSNFSMGNDVADFNNDGLLDIMVVDMVAEDNKRLKENMGGMQLEDFRYFLSKGYYYQYMFNMLHMNTGNNTFSDVAHLADVSNTDWSWAPLFVDFDNDGLKDLYVTNGLRRDARNQDARYVFVDLLKKANAEGRQELTEEEWMKALEAMPSQKLKNYMFKNVNGLRFEKVMDDWGLDVPSFSNGAAYADLDNDGDMDLIVSNINDPAFIYENRQESNNHIRFDLAGPAKNPNGIGTTVRIWTGEELQLQQQQFNHGFRSAMANPIHFGIGSHTSIDSVAVTWSDGRTQTVYDLTANERHGLNYEDAKSPERADDHKNRMFAEASIDFQPEFRHRENTFDDYEREILLPHTMSALGPFLSKGDVNGDGLEDIYIGGSIEYPGVLYLQTASGKFEQKAQPSFEADREYEDAGSLFFDSDGDGDQDLYVVSGGNEYYAGGSYYQDRLYLNDGQGNFISATDRLPRIGISGSIVLAHDFDGDGDPDLFVGGRQTPGKYPYPTSSLLLENENGRFVDQTDQWCPGLKDIGMVSSAIWIDYDMDKDQDLIVSGEWMPLTVFRNDNGQLTRISAGLENTEGWWFSLAAADLDNDGDQDFVAGNVGLNYKYKASQETPFEIYSEDLDGNGKNDIVLAYYEEDKLFPLRGKSCSTQQMPGLKTKFPTYSAFAVAELDDVYGEQNLEKALRYQARMFASVYAENLGNGSFRIHELPDYAQLSSVNGIVIRDMDQDGFKDLILAGNMYGSEIETVRNDAGFGMYLKNVSGKSFRAVPFRESGFYMDGDVKSLIPLNTKSKDIILGAINDELLQAIKVNHEKKEQVKDHE